VIAAAATERLPHPVAFEAVVTRHLESRTVAVMPADSGGQAGRLWSRGYRALAEAEGNWRSTVPTPWGHVGRRRQAARGAPGEGGTLRFRFPPGEAAWSELVSMPALGATVTLDRDTGAFLGCRFHSRRT
jgi:hypothetical protein